MKRLLVGGAVLALGIGSMGISQAAPAEYKVTGGGQSFGFEAPVSGAGDTIGFNAQSAPTMDNEQAAKGQVQYVDREEGKQVANIHGVVECLRVEGDRAVIGGRITRGGTEEFFQLDVLDSGQEDRGTDMVVFQELATEPACDEQREFDEDPVLARGNVKIHQTRPAE